MENYTVAVTVMPLLPVPDGEMIRDELRKRGVGMSDRCRHRGTPVRELAAATPQPVREDCNIEALDQKAFDQTLEPSQDLVGGDGLKPPTLSV